MNTLKYSLEYHCYPIWHYDKDGDLIDNDLPAELLSNTELDSLLMKIQTIFDSLFIDTPKEFSSHGFYSESERQEFLSLLFTSVDYIREHYGDNYHIICDYTRDSFPVEQDR